jgi:prepilin-type N-terminal cleavage/methylation domain-containing protein
MTSTTGQIKIPRCGGFTLLELLLVLVLIGVVVAIAVPSLRAFAGGQQADDAAANILSLTRWAQSQAITLGRPCRLNVDSGSGTYWLTVQEQGEYVPLKSDFGQTFRLPDGVSLDLQFDQDQDQTPQAQNRTAGPGGIMGALGRKASGRNYIVFHPSGRCDVATIQVHGKKGEVFQISCASATEPFVMNSSSEDR